MEKKNSTVEGVKISYNDKFVIKLKNKDIKGRKKKIKEQLEVENKAKTDFEKSMKLKSEEY